MLSKTPSRKRMRERFLFDEIEENIRREENDSSLVGILSEKLICLDATWKYDETTANIIGSEIVQEIHDSESGDFQCRNSGKTVGKNSFIDISSTDAVPSKMPSFSQELQTLQAMVHNVESSFPDLIFAMATTGNC